MKKLLKTLVCALGLAAGLFAHADNGDVYEIRPCNAQGETIKPRTIDNPLKSGETFYFRMRLIGRSDADPNDAWQVKYKGTGTAELYRLQIGLYVTDTPDSSGTGPIRWATLVNDPVPQQILGTYYTDLIFSYTVQPGEFALPIRLAADATSPITDKDPSTAFYLNPLTAKSWSINTENGATCNFWQWTPDRGVENPEVDKRQSDVTLSNCGFYVKTIDFDANWQVAQTENNPVWRTIHKNSTTPKNGIAPSLTAIAAVSQAVTLYVWSEDDSIITVDGGAAANLPLDNENGSMSTHIGQVTIYGGQMTGDFTLKAVGNEGQKANLVLSSTPYYTISSGTGSRVVDYLTVPVTVGEPLPPTLTVKTSDENVTADENFSVSKASIWVEASQAYTNDVEITITPAVIGAAGVGEYVKFSTQNQVADVASLPSAITVKLSAGETETAPVYAYFLRADTHTTSVTEGITFTPGVADAAANTYFTSKNPAKVKVTSTPVVSVDSPFNAVAGDPTDVEITVKDAYADMKDRTKGYEIWVKYPGATGSSFTQLAGTYYVGQGNNLYALGANGTETLNKPQLKFPKAVDSQDAFIYVVSPVSGQLSSKLYAFKAVVQAARTITVTTDKDTYQEGDIAKFEVELSAENETGSTLYAYLRPSNPDEDVTKFKGGNGYNPVIGKDGSGNVVGSRRGWPIRANKKTVSGTVQLLDGLSEAEGGLSLAFEVVLSTKANWDGTTSEDEVSGYTSDEAGFSVFNVEPTITRLEMNGVAAEGSGYKYPNRIPKGMARRFQAIVEDKGTYDLTNANEPAEDYQFQTKWTTRRNNIVVGDPKVIYGNPNSSAKTFEYTFNQSGTWEIIAQVKDKDMNDWSTTNYTVQVEVLNNPTVEITPSSETYYETERGGKIAIGLSYWDEQQDEPLEVEVTIAPKTTVPELKVNPGLLKIDSANNDIVTGSYSYDDDTRTTTVKVRLTSTAPVELAISEMDGTMVSSVDGFTIDAKVTSTTTLPTSGQPANDYYTKAKTQRVYVENVAPSCSFQPAEANTNAWEVSGGLASSYPITWTVRSDVDADFGTTTENWPEAGVRVTITGCDNGGSWYVTEATSRKFVPDFGSAQGDRTVTVTIEDKDSDATPPVTMTYKYTIAPSKYLTLIAGGPAGATANNEDSTKYASAGGRGEGHVYAGSTLAGATAFRLKWNCSSDTTRDAYAFGYKVGAVDNGSLNGGVDCAISASGGMPAAGAGNYYEYKDTEKDSFFYRWLPIAVDSSGGNSGQNAQASSSLIAPETKKGASTISITLPTKMTDDKKGYFETQYEAVFAKEYRAKDNLGDINQDGIPDIYAVRKWKSGEALADASTDLKSLASYWVEGDYLPMIYAQWSESTCNYAPGSVSTVNKFTAFTKLRGFHAGLNDTEYANGEADFGLEEKYAYQAAFYKNKFEADKGREWTAADGFGNDAYKWQEADGYDLAVWSPEPTSRMDLTLTDTDADNFPDGWEYFFWYQAKVWAPAAGYAAAVAPDALKNKSTFTAFGLPRAGQTFVFERFNPSNIVEGTAIPFEEVVQHFDPIQKSNDGLADFDGDGLADLEELALGTNPCHWDTDGDHMSDGWEILMGTNASMDNRKENADGDYMAFFSAKGREYFEKDGLYFIKLEDSVDDEEAKIHRNLLVVQPKFEADGTTPYLYGRLADTNIETRVWARQMVEKPATGWRTNVTYAAAEAQDGFKTLDGQKEIILIHSQVYEAFGFDPRTAWAGEGYVSGRWEKAGDEAGKSVNTVPYTDYDEYLLRRYRQDMQTIPEAQKITKEVESEFERFAQWTTCPSVVLVTNVTVSVDSTTSSDLVEGYKDALNNAEVTNRKQLMSVHGADTSGNGVPDGWTLYVGENPCSGSSAGKEDGDGLSFVEEFAGTDSCNAYKTCETIYANHPGIKKGWYNKFFPTDPSNPDTDGDGVSDGKEGADWLADFPYEGETHAGMTFRSIYGKPVDDGSRCIRGGGMNPCAVDTDRDGLPDGWERQFAGLPFNALSKEFLVSNTTDRIEVKLAQLRADGLMLTNGVSNVVYIAGGMDPTWPGDSKASANDDLLERVRDLDFDHDGLANGQEYLVQQVRHFRYDDDVTPLMKYALVGTDTSTTRTVLDAEGKVQYKGYRTNATLRAIEKCVPMNLSLEVLNTNKVVNGTTLKELLANGSDDFKMTAEVWRSLGYWAPPLHANWDTSASYILLAPTVESTPGNRAELENLRRERRYVSTDPRKHDSDEDGMDDYWELYHGLNPILGAKDIIAEAYAGSQAESVPTYAKNAWTAAHKGGENSPAADEPKWLYDPSRYPWAMGLPKADADGDGLRNDEEKALANLASPLNYHTDPTPAWYTDPTSEESFASLYYKRSHYASTASFWTVAQGTSIDAGYYEAAHPLDSELGSIFAFSFETSEGYDTDNDLKGDAYELTRTVRQATDPLNPADPARRQALYLDGKNSYVASYEAGLRKTAAADLLKQFTVEAWVYPESTADQTIVDRIVYQPASSENKDLHALRSTFRIGIKDGRPYGLFDNSNPIESGTGEPTSCQRVQGKGALETNKWTHLALTYTGKTLELYVNGESANYATTTLIPATGVFQIKQNATLDGVEAYSSYPSTFFIGAREKLVDGNVSLQSQTTEFFKGWIDEVRVWDGARSAQEIKDNYMKAFTFDDVATNREEVYTHLLSANADASRNDNVDKKSLAPELLQHYNFAALPSAKNAADVITAPIGFMANVVDQIAGSAASGVATAAPSGEVGWKGGVNTPSSVYTNPYFATWIPNTVSHLPVLDGSSSDTFVYSKYLGGYTLLASEAGTTTHTFRNTANPYGYRDVSVIDRAMRLFKLDHLRQQLPQSEIVDDVARRYMYEMRSGFSATGDLVPHGGAFAKACANMWDGSGASAPWEDTGADTDADGLPDWWEKMYCGNTTGLSWDTEVNYHGKMIPAWQAYLRDLAKGMQPDGTVDNGYIQTADADGDGLVDWWKDLYGLTGNANADDDGDGLSNYVEYLLSEVFDLGLTFDPTVACSVNPNVSDYFYRLGQMYVGEIFTDHDRISDVWEDGYATEFASRYAYDADEDKDGDGWSNYAEFLAGTDPEVVSVRNIDGERVPEYPVPTIEANFVYDGKKNVQDHALVVKAFSDPNLETIADAQWTIGGNSTNLVVDTKYLGYNPGVLRTFRLPPGKINPGSVTISAKDLGLQVWRCNGGYVKENTVLVNPNDAQWTVVIYDRVHAASEQTGDLVRRTTSALTSNVTETVVGSIDYYTGETVVDFSKIQEVADFVSDLTGAWPKSGEELNYVTYVTSYDLAKSNFRINWKASPLVESGKTTYYLGTADQRSTENNSQGHVKEGRNTFIAFYDLNDDGEYTAGEPYGTVKDVQVGWNTTPLTIVLTDTHPVFARLKVIGDDRGTNDRTVIYGKEDSNITAADYGFKEGTPAGGEKERIRVVRTAIDGRRLYREEERTVLDKMVSKSAEKYITEADILKNALDLDWECLAQDIAAKSDLSALEVTSVWYRVVMGNENLATAALASNNVMSVLISRNFDSAYGYKLAKPVILISGDVKTPQPVFKWRLQTDGLNTYTAFRAWVYAADGQTLVWDSDYQPMPPRVYDFELKCHAYTWRPPLYAGALLPDGSGVFENGKNYQWKLEVYNAKFNPEYNKKMTRNPSEPATFLMNVMTNSTDYGQINLAIRYFGPDVVAQNGKIRVQAFTSADFTGDPVAEGYVYNTDDIASTNKAMVANARIIGLEEGTYYVRAFIDTKPAGADKYDGRFAAWKSWGLVCNRDDKLAKIYVPKPVVIGSHVGTSPALPLYIEDCDTDHDNLPDAWEMQTKGNLKDLTTSSLDQVLPGGFAMKTALSRSITAAGTLPGGLSTMLQASLESPYVAAMLLNVQGDNLDTMTNALASLSVGLDAQASRIAITGIAIDAASNQVVLDVTTDLKSAGSTLASRLYVFDKTDEVNVVLWRKDSLSDETWEPVGSGVPVLFGEVSKKQIRSDLPKGQDLTSGFYKVTVEKAQN